MKNEISHNCFNDDCGFCGMRDCACKCHEKKEGDKIMTAGTTGKEINKIPIAEVRRYRFSNWNEYHLLDTDTKFVQLADFKRITDKLLADRQSLKKKLKESLEREVRKLDDITQIITELKDEIETLKHERNEYGNDTIELEKKVREMEAENKAIHEEFEKALIQCKGVVKEQHKDILNSLTKDEAMEIIYRNIKIMKSCKTYKSKCHIRGEECFECLPKALNNNFLIDIFAEKGVKIGVKG